MANILTIITTLLTTLGIKIPGCLGTSDASTLQRYAMRMYNVRRNEYRPVAMRHVTGESETAAANHGKTISYEDAAQIAHCTLDALRFANIKQVQGLLEAAPNGVAESDPIALAAAQAAAEFGVTVE